ncbi:hypothetical protein HGRIS_013958 [Hohenbuehelia grisea]|uniref:Uncharacterized protein n=1 Tax=Hohenbuehelia grisea TaxID=104357 RepID=A0ABR3JTB7_9AGAR
MAVSDKSESEHRGEFNLEATFDVRAEALLQEGEALCSVVKFLGHGDAIKIKGYTSQVAIRSDRGCLIYPSVTVCLPWPCDPVTLALVYGVRPATSARILWATH